MLTIAFVSLRETCEATLLIGIVMTFLRASGALKSTRHAWYGVVAGIIISIACFIVLSIMHAEIPEHQRALYEGWLMITSAILVSTLVLSISYRSISLQESIETSLQRSLEASSVAGIFFIAFTAITREGVELAIFLQALLVDSPRGIIAIIACFSGILAGIVIAYILIRWLSHLRIRFLLRISGFILLLIAIELAIEGMEKLGIIS